MPIDFPPTMSHRIQPFTKISRSILGGERSVPPTKRRPRPRGSPRPRPGPPAGHAARCRPQRPAPCHDGDVPHRPRDLGRRLRRPQNDPRQHGRVPGASPPPLGRGGRDLGGRRPDLRPDLARRDLPSRPRPRTARLPATTSVMAATASTAAATTAAAATGSSVSRAAASGAAPPGFRPPEPQPRPRPRPPRSRRRSPIARDGRDLARRGRPPRSSRSKALAATANAFAERLGLPPVSATVPLAPDGPRRSAGPVAAPGRRARPRPPPPPLPAGGAPRARNGREEAGGAGP